MRRLLPVAALVLATAAATASTAALATTTTETASSAPAPSLRIDTPQTFDNGRPRAFLLHIPSQLLAPAPLVLVLHGLLQDMAHAENYTRLDRLADRDGFVVAYAGGVGGSWDAGTCCGTAAAQRVDDIAYLDQVIALSRARTVVDPARIYLAGFSNGGMMALRYACARSRVVAAVAVVAGDLLAPCHPAAPVAVLDLHGTADSVVPLSGGPSRALRMTLPAVRTALEPFTATGGEVAVRPVPGAGHEWFAEPRGDDVDASEAVWDWLRDHPQPLS